MDAPRQMAKTCRDAAIRASSPYTLAPVPAVLGGPSTGSGRDEWMLLRSGVEICRGPRRDIVAAYNRCVDGWLRISGRASP